LQPQKASICGANTHGAERSMLLGLLRLPIELLVVAGCILVAVADVVRGRQRRRFESTALIKAPREAVWRLISADRIVLDGPPAMEMVTEPIDGEDGLKLSRVSVGGREVGRVVHRALESDAAAGTTLMQIVPHYLSRPPAEGRDHVAGMAVANVPGGTALTMFHEVTFGPFRQRIALPLGVRGMVGRIKRQCEKEAGTGSRIAGYANHWLVLSILAVASFWYLLGWQDALLIALVIVLHELGHAAAMLMVGIRVQGIYLIPFFGGAAVPKTAYRSQGQLGFVALMGPGFSLVPTLALAGLHYAVGDPWLLHAALVFALVNGFNLLPVYPLDGGLILNALLGSVNPRLARAASWTGVLVGLGAALYFQSLLIGIPVLVFALGLYLGGGWTFEAGRLSLLGGTALVLAFVSTFAVYLVAFGYAAREQYIADRARDAGPPQARVRLPFRCDLPATSDEVLERLLGEGSAGDGLGVMTHGSASLIRLFAWADRAGHGDLLARFVEAPTGAGLPPHPRRIGRWQALARSAPLADIELEIATSPREPAAGDPRQMITAALITYGRYPDALALFPQEAPIRERSIWLEQTLADLVLAGATTEALALLERTRAATIATGQSQHLTTLASRLLERPAGLGDRKELVAALTEQLPAVHKARPAGRAPQVCLPGSPCTDEDAKRINRHFDDLRLRVSEMEALARLGRTDFDLPADLLDQPESWWHTLAVASAALAERGEAEKAEDLRRRVARSSLEVKAFDVARTGTRIAFALARGDAKTAETLAEAATGQGWVPVSIRIPMTDHYLSVGDWARAEAWAKRDTGIGATGPGGGRPRIAASPELVRSLELAYRTNLAEAAAEKGEAALAEAALERARALACEQAGAFLPQQWPTFLRAAYLVRAVLEGRLPRAAIERLP
jgi:Zn-dependent protease